MNIKHLTATAALSIITIGNLYAQQNITNAIDNFIGNNTIKEYIKTNIDENDDCVIIRVNEGNGKSQRNVSIKLDDYEISKAFELNGLEEEIKELTGKSPDIADALALTFAHPVRPKGFGRGGGRARCNTDYDLFD